MTNPMFYREIAPLNSETHRQLRLKPAAQPFGFAGQAHVVPALSDELAVAVGMLPSAFLPGPNAPTAVFVTGMAPGSSLMIDENGKWTGKYVPAYLRRYPFIMGDVEGSDPVLCLDTQFEGISETEGERLFDDAGEVQEPLRRALALAEGYRLSAKTTEAFCQRLLELNLFRSVSLDVKRQDGQSSVVHGLLIVDEAALEALPGKTIAALAAENFLKPIYAHLFGLASLDLLAQRIDGDQIAA